MQQQQYTIKTGHFKNSLKCMQEQMTVLSTETLDKIMAYDDYTNVRVNKT